MAARIAAAHVRMLGTNEAKQFSDQKLQVCDWCGENRFERSLLLLRNHGEGCRIEDKPTGMSK